MSCSTALQRCVLTAGGALLTHLTHRLWCIGNSSTWHTYRKQREVGRGLKRSSRWVDGDKDEKTNTDVWRGGDRNEWRRKHTETLRIHPTYFQDVYTEIKTCSRWWSSTCGACFTGFIPSRALLRPGRSKCLFNNPSDRLEVWLITQIIEFRLAGLFFSAGFFNISRRTGSL